MSEFNCTRRDLCLVLIESDGNDVAVLTSYIRDTFTNFTQDNIAKIVASVQKNLITNFRQRYTKSGRSLGYGFEKWSATTNENKDLKKQKKAYVQRRFREELGLNIDLNKVLVTAMTVIQLEDFLFYFKLCRVEKLLMLQNSVGMLWIQHKDILINICGIICHHLSIKRHSALFSVTPRTTFRRCPGIKEQRV